MTEFDLHEARVRFTVYASMIPTQAKEFGLECFREEAKRAQVAAAVNALTSQQKAEVALLLDDHGYQALGLAVHNAGVGILLSLHTLGLAEDYTFFRINPSGGPAAPALESDYTKMGEWWEALAKKDGVPLKWGGRFKKVDMPHFSWGWGGRE